MARCDGPLEKPCGKVGNFTIDPSIAGLVLDALQTAIPDSQGRTRIVVGTGVDDLRERPGTELRSLPDIPLPPQPSG